VYDPPPGHPHWYLQYLSLLLVGVALLLAAIAYPVMKRQQAPASGRFEASRSASGLVAEPS